MSTRVLTTEVMSLFNMKGNKGGDFMSTRVLTTEVMSLFNMKGNNGKISCLPEFSQTK